jgi:hypothetical protein
MSVAAAVLALAALSLAFSARMRADRLFFFLCSSVGFFSQENQHFLLFCWGFQTFDMRYPFFKPVRFSFSMA